MKNKEELINPQVKSILDIFRNLRDQIVSEEVPSDKALKMMYPFFELLSQIETMKVDKHITPSYIIATMTSDDPQVRDKQPELNYNNILMRYYKYLDNSNIKQHI